MRRSLPLALSLSGVAAVAPATAAHAYPAITSRDYTLDLFAGPVVGSDDVTAMGGATVATARGSDTMMTNPASIAIYPETIHGGWDWDAHFDYLVAQPGSTFDNTGSTARAASDSSLFSTGLSLQLGRWAIGWNTLVRDSVVPTPGGTGNADPSFSITDVALARSLFAGDVLTVGVGIRAADFSVGTWAYGARTQTLFDLHGAALEAGAIWRPWELPIRAGLSAVLPVVGNQVTVSGCDPSSCDGFILPSQAQAPWQVAAGLAWRRGERPWNQPVPGYFRDEHELVVEGDLVVTGPVSGGVSLNGFLAQVAQPSGTSLAVSPRAGVSYEWIPGWVRVRAGTYWEPGRVVDVSGRLHGTLGAEARFLSFSFFGSPYRLSASAAIDGAPGYGEGDLSLGFWD